MLIISILSWVALALAFFAQILIIFKNKKAFILWNIGSILYIGISAYEHDLPQALLFFSYFFFDTIAYIMWWRDDNKKGNK